MGRPSRTTEGPAAYSARVALTASEHAALVALARRWGCSLACAIRRAITEAAAD